jgi:hypothetical protein
VAGGRRKEETWWSAASWNLRGKSSYIAQISRSRVCDDQTVGSEVGIVGVTQVRKQWFTFRVKETGAECVRVP